MSKLSIIHLFQLADLDNHVIYTRSEDGTLRVESPGVTFSIEPIYAYYFWRAMFAEALENEGLARDARPLEIEEYLKRRDDKPMA